MVHNPHFLLVTCPAQGHINPTLQLAKRLIITGAHVTFVTAHRRVLKIPTIDGLTYAPFSDGYENGLKPTDDLNLHESEFKRRGSQSITDLVVALANKRRPVTFLFYTILLPWVSDVGRNLHIPSALLWIQPATVFDIYYYYFNGYAEVITSSNNDPSYTVQLPGLPLLTCRDIPSFLLPTSTNTDSYFLSRFRQVFEILERDTNPRVLINTFDALEPEELRAVHKINLIRIGPLIPSAFLDRKDQSDTSFGGDLFHGSPEYMEWLKSMPESSVVYVSFGSISVLSKRQTDEIADGLVKSQRPFLWVIRPDEKREEREEGEDTLVRDIERGTQQGKIVTWCSQVEVLSHPSVGCFVTHCGWNSTLESLVGGVPLVAFPQWSDQGTNAKLVEDVWKTGMRVKVSEEEKIVESEELRRCLEIVMGGESGKKMRRNAKKWKDLAGEAVEEGGSSDKNLQAFVEGVGQDCW